MVKPISSTIGSIASAAAKKISEAVTQPKPAVTAEKPEAPKQDGFKAEAPKSPDVTKAPEFKKLDKATQTAITDSLKPVNDPVAKKNVGDVVLSPGFGKLPVKTQGEVVKALMKDPGNPEYTSSLKALVNNGGPYKDLCIGSKGPAVTELQKELKAAGHDPGKIDGDFGPDTSKALKAYQTAKGLKSDGIAGEETIGELKQKRFSGLSETSQAQLLGQLSNHPKDATARETISKMALSPGFRGLDQANQTKLLNLTGGTNRDISKPSREAVNQIVSDPSYAGLTPEKQKAQLEKFLTDEPGLPGVVAPETGAFDGKRAKYTVTGPTDVKDYEFRGGKAEAKKYEVEIDGKKVPVFMPKDQDKALEYHSIEEVAKGLAALPKSSRDLITKVNVEGKKNADDAHWAKEFGDPNFSSYMSANKEGRVSIYPSKPGGKNSQSYLDGTMIHETGHTLAKQKWGEDDDKRWDPWRAAATSDGVHASQYAKNNVSEDFGETLQLYQQVKGTPQEAEVRALMPGRFKIIDDLLAGK